jgi:hypothetical protein
MAWLPSGIPGLHHQYTAPAQPFGRAPGLPLPMPSASVYPANIYSALQNRRDLIASYPENVRLTPAEHASATAPFGRLAPSFERKAGYHESAVCEMELGPLARTITDYIAGGEGGVIRAMEQLKACAYFREEASKRFGGFNPGHAAAYKLVLNLYSAIQQLGRAAIGATITYEGGGFYILKDGDRAFVGTDGIRYLGRGGKRRKQTRRNKRKGKKTRRVLY